MSGNISNYLGQSKIKKLFNNYLKGKATITLSNGPIIPHFPEYDNIKFLHYHLAKFINNQQVMYKDSTVKNNFVIKGTMNEILNNQTINQSVTVEEFENTENAQQTFIEQVNTVSIYQDLIVKYVSNYNMQTDIIKITNPNLIIEQQLPNTNTKMKGMSVFKSESDSYNFVWLQNSEKIQQFYCIDSNNQLLKFKFQSTNSEVSDTYLKYSGGTMTGNLTLYADPISNYDQQTKNYVDSKVTQTSPIRIHHHNSSYIKKIGGQMATESMLNLVYPIDLENTAHNNYQINKITQDTIQGAHNHETLYIDRNGDVLTQNLEIKDRQYGNLSSLTEDENKRQQTKNEGDSRQEGIIYYNHTNYLNKIKNIGDENYIEYQGQIFLKKMPRIDELGSFDLINKKYVDTLSGLNTEGLLYFSIIEINMGWVSWMYEYTFDFQSWYDSYIEKLPVDLLPTHGNVDNFVVVPIVTFKTLRGINKYQGFGYKNPSGGSAADGIVNYKICQPYYHTEVDTKKCLYKFKIRLGQFGFNRIDPTTTPKVFTQSNQTSGFVNYRIYFLGFPQSILTENWNSDSTNSGNLKEISSKYSQYNSFISLFTSNEQTDFNNFDVDFCNYSTQL